MSIFRTKNFDSMEKLNDYLVNPMYFINKNKDANISYHPNRIEIILSLPLSQLNENMIKGEANERLFEQLTIPEQNALDFMLELKEEEKDFHKQDGYHYMDKKTREKYMRDLQKSRKKKIDDAYPYFIQDYKLLQSQKTNSILPDNLKDDTAGKMFKWEEPTKLQNIKEITHDEQEYEQYDMGQEDKPAKGGKHKRKTRRKSKKSNKTRKHKKNKKGGTKETKPKNKTIKTNVNKKVRAENIKLDIEKTRPLHFSEYEEWYEIVANEDLHSQLPYMRYLNEYHQNKK